MKISQFTELPVSNEIIRAVESMGFTETTPIQAESIPHILEGRNILGQAQTGTGKTCAFGIPVIERVDPDNKSIQYLILSPTRELAIQITDELREVCQFKEAIKIASVYGGQPIQHQIFALKKKPQIVVGTPGRIMDHMRRKTIRLHDLSGIILDEADEMLNMGFKDDIDTILSEAPDSIQHIFFSATMPKGILELTDKYLKDPVHVRIAEKQMTVQKIDQQYIELKANNKLEVLSRLIEADQVQLALVFCNTKRRTDELTEQLKARGYAAEALHGDMNQSIRTRVMTKFKKKELRILVATDVAARGIDVDDIELVINYDVPQDDEYYVHRIGRTGRAGKTGRAYTFVVGREILTLRQIERFTKSTIAKSEVPSLQSVTRRQVKQRLNTAVEGIEAQVHDQYLAYIESYLEKINAQNPEQPPMTAHDLAAVMLRQSMADQISQDDDIEPVVPYEDYLKQLKNSGNGNRDSRYKGRSKPNYQRSGSRTSRPQGSKHSQSGDAYKSGSQSSSAKKGRFSNRSGSDRPAAHKNSSIDRKPARQASAS